METKISQIGELGLFSTKDIKCGEVVYTLSGTVLDHPERESIHVGNNVHIVDPNGSFMNHSFTPSTKICGYNVVAVVDIRGGDELTFNYNESELLMSCPFEVDGVMVTGSSDNIKRKNCRIGESGCGGECGGESGGEYGGEYGGDSECV
jgi:hypothetical protein